MNTATMPNLGLAPEVEQRPAKTFRDKSVDELTVEDCKEMLRAAHRGEPPPLRPSWKSLAQYLPADPDFLKERPELFDFERVDKLFEDWVDTAG